MRSAKVFPVFRSALLSFCSFSPCVLFCKLFCLEANQMVVEEKGLGCCFKHSDQAAAALCSDGVQAARAAELQGSHVLFNPLRQMAACLSCNLAKAVSIEANGGNCVCCSARRCAITLMLEDLIRSLSSDAKPEQASPWHHACWTQSQSYNECCPAFHPAEISLLPDTLAFAPAQNHSHYSHPPWQHQHRTLRLRQHHHLPHHEE